MSRNGEGFEFLGEVNSPLPDGVKVPGDIAGALVALADGARVRNRDDARRVLMVSEVYRLRREQLGCGVDPCAVVSGFVDDFDVLEAELGAALQVGRAAAGREVALALDLRERVPDVLALMSTGVLSLPLARVVVARGQAIADPALVAEFSRRVAAQLQARLSRHGATLTPRQVEALADKLIAVIDLDARREKPKTRRDFLDVSPAAGDKAVVTVRLAREKGAQLAGLIDEVATTVCCDDGRDRQQREVDAFCAIIDGYATLGCRCGAAACEWGERRPRVENLPDRVHVDLLLVLNETAYTGPDADKSDSASQEGEACPDLFGEDRGSAAAGPIPPGAGSTGAVPAPFVARDPAAPAIAGAAGIWLPGLVVAGGHVGAGLGGPVGAGDLRSMLARCEVHVRTAGTRRADGTIVAAAGSGYVPTAVQQQVVRIRHGVCAFPGCQVPAERCQLDHVVEYDHADPASGGATDVWNMVPLCGFHHRIKTHTGWLSDLLPDGTVEWRHPDGMVYLAGLEQGTDLFPALDALAWETRRHGTTAGEAGAPDEQKPVDGAPSRIQARNRQREALRERNRRLRHEDDEALGLQRDEPPPF
ncbi:HNH endonuclease signature motif containing protein [Tsukamurella soli]|uniref:HNH endonuclease signature motif containing protein n=1 Tax=Tsukamurella soli TaxID=644556 RepID=A0ABP8JM22_9ACTN